MAVTELGKPNLAFSRISNPRSSCSDAYNVLDTRQISASCKLFLGDLGKPYEERSRGVSLAMSMWSPLFVLQWMEV